MWSCRELFHIFPPARGQAFRVAGRVLDEESSSNSEKQIKTMFEFIYYNHYLSSSGRLTMFLIQSWMLPNPGRADIWQTKLEWSQSSPCLEIYPKGIGATSNIAYHQITSNFAKFQSMTVCGTSESLDGLTWEEKKQVQKGVPFGASIAHSGRVWKLEKLGPSRTLIWSIETYLGFVLQTTGFPFPIQTHI